MTRANAEPEIKSFYKGVDWTWIDYKDGSVRMISNVTGCFIDFGDD